MSVDKIEEETKSRKAAILNLAAQMLASSETPELTPDEIQAIREVNSTAQKALHETEHVIPGKDQKMSRDVSLELPSDAEAVQRAAAETPVVSPKIPHSVFDLSSKKRSNSTSLAQNKMGAVVDKLVQETETSISEEYPSTEAEERGRAVLANLEEIHRVDPTRFPNVAREMITRLLEKEEKVMGQLERYKQEAETHKVQIQRFLKLSGLLDALPKDQPTYNLKEAILDQLTSPEKEDLEQCIKEAFPTGSFVITKEQLAGGKVRLGDIMSEHKTAMTNLLTTKISPTIHIVQVNTQTMQNILRLMERLLGTIIRNFGTR